MSRSIREESKLGCYHVMQRGVGKQILFEDEQDYRRYYNKLMYCRKELDFELLAFCLMNNHVHLLVKTNDMRILETLMRRLGTSYGRYYNGKYSHVGSVFQGRFRSQAINGEGRLLRCVRYIHNNPVKAGFCARDKYRWSSYLDYTDGIGITDTEYVLGELGGLENFMEFSASLDKDSDNDYMDCETTAITIEDGINIVRKHFGNQIENAFIVKRLQRAERDHIIGEMKAAGLRNKQIELITGVSQEIIRRVSVR